MSPYILRVEFSDICAIYAATAVQLLHKKGLFLFFPCPRVVYYSDLNAKINLNIFAYRCDMPNYLMDHHSSRHYHFQHITASDKSGLFFFVVCLFKKLFLVQLQK